MPIPKWFPQPLLIWRFGRETGDTTMRDFGAWSYQQDNYGKSLDQQQFHRASELFDLAALRDIAAAKPFFPGYR